MTDSPIRDLDTKPELPEKRLRTPSPKLENSDKSEVSEKLGNPEKNGNPDKLVLDNETGELTKEELNITSKPAEELNREFLESLKNPEEEKAAKIFVKPVEKLIEPSLGKMESELTESKNEGSSVFLNELAQKLNLGKLLLTDFKKKRYIFY